MISATPLEVNLAVTTVNTSAGGSKRSVKRMMFVAVGRGKQKSEVADAHSDAGTIEEGHRVERVVNGVERDRG